MSLMRLRAAAAALGVIMLGGGAAAQNVETVRTPSGIAFGYAHLPKKPNQVVAFSWRDGTALAAQQKQAVGQVGASWMMRGSLTRTAGDIEETLKDLQGGFSFFSGMEAFVGTVQAPLAEFAQTIDLAEDSLTNPALPPRALARIKRGYTERITQSVNNNAGHASEMLSYLTSDDAGFLRMWLQDDASVATPVERADVEAWRKSVLARDRLTVAAAGPMSKADVAAQIDRLFRNLPAASTAPMPAAPSFRTSQKFAVMEKPGPQSIVRMSGFSGWKPGLRAFEGGLAATILGGGGFASRLTLNLREKLGATYGVSAGHGRILGDQMSLTIQTAVAHDKLGAVLAALKDEYQRFVADGVTEPEFEAAKLRLKTAILNARDEPSIATAIRDNAALGFGLDAGDRILANLDALTRDALNAAIKANFPPWPLAVAVVTPSASGLKADCVVKTAAEAAKCR